MDVQQLLEAKKIPFQVSGRDFKVRCLNPEHDDSDPSMRIDRLTGIFGCFVCGFKGNLFSYFSEKANYLQIRRDLFKRKISEKLAENIGLNIPVNAVPFNREWRNISAKTYKEFGAFEHSDPGYIGRVVFPIRNIAGKIIGFNGRAMSPSTQPKYMITPDKAKFPLFPAKVEPIQGSVILVEGIFDMLNLHDKGLTNTVCAFGTQKLTKEKLNILKMQGITNVDILFDGDEAGVEAAVKASELIESVELTSRTITLKNTDPGEMTAHKVLKLKETLYG